MAGETVITLVGNLVDDPELRFTPSGAAGGGFSGGQSAGGAAGGGQAGNGQGGNDPWATASPGASAGGSDPWSTGPSSSEDPPF